MKTLKHNVILVSAVAVLFAQAIMPVTAYGDSFLTSDDASSSSEVLPVADEVSGDETTGDENSGDEITSDDLVRDEVSGDDVQELEVASSEADNIDNNQTPQPSDVEAEEAQGSEPVAFSESGISQAGVAVHASAAPGVLPAGTTMRLKDASQVQAKVAAYCALNDSVESAQGVDISFYNAEGIEIEPNGNVEVSMQLAGALEGQSFTLIHVPDNGSVENMGQATSTGANFTSDEFSLYVIAGSGTEQDPISNVYREYTIGLGETVTILSDEKNHDGTWIPGISGNSWNVVDTSGGNVNNLVTLEPYSGSADVQPRLIVTAKDKPGTIRVAFNYIHPVDKTHKTVTGAFTAKHYYLIHIVDKSSSPYSYSVQFKNNNGTGVSRVGEGDLSYTTEDGVTATRTVSSDFIHTFTISEDPSTRAGKVTLAMPEFPGADTYKKNGVTYKFVGWSVLSDANSSLSGSNLMSIVYPFPDAHVFKPGERFPLDRSLTLWAIWAPQDSQKVKFFMRIDDHIPNEPQSHGNASYTEIGSNLTYYLKDAHFESDAIYGVDQGWAEGRNKPWPARVFSDLKAAGKLPADVTDVNIFKARYRIVWSSVKRENDGWHVDGVLYRKDLYNLAYHANGDLAVVSSMPEGVKDIPAGETTLIDSRIPNRYDMVFTGWNTQADGKGTHYNPGETVVVSEHPELDTSINTLHLYAQWEKSTRYMYHVRYLEADTNRELKAPVYYGSQIMGNRISSLDESNKATSDIEGYLFSYATPAIGEDLVIGEDNSKNVITLYYMPLAEEVRATEIRINKVDDKGNPLAGAQFKLTGNGKEKTYTSDADGIVHIPFVDDPGEAPAALIYTLTEVGAPPGYVTSDETFTFRVSRGDPKVVSYFPDASKTVYPLVVSRLTTSDDGEPIIGDANGITVVNTYKASGSWTPLVTKALSGRDLVAGEFGFELWAVDGEGQRIGDAPLQTAKNAADGSVAFGPIAYTEADAGKTYTYTVSEVEGTLGGVTYDKDIRTVTVTVTDNGDHTLNVSVTIKLGDAVAEALAFINTYTAKGSATFKVNKVLTGRTLADEQFSFELKDANGDVLQTKKNAADGTVTFDPIAYTLDDVGKTFTYTIAEKNDAAAGYTYDSHIVGVSVEVTDNGDGTLKAEVAYTGDTTFTNLYGAKGSATLKASKSLTGRGLTGGDFAFELRDANDDVLQTVSNDSQGDIVFAPIIYSEADAGKTFTYKIVEKDDAKPGYTYDGHAFTASVTVTDNADGTLSTEVAYSGGQPFANTYAASGTWTPLSVSKTLTGRALEAEQFTFELKNSAGDVLQTKKNDARGVVTFDDIAYTEADMGKTFTYTVTEKNDGLPGYTYDGHTLTATVTVTDNGDGTLDTRVAYTGETTFTNEYKASGSWAPSVTKVLSGRDLASGEFEFELWAVDGEGQRIGDVPLQTVKNVADGSVAFAPIAYTEADAGKTYIYTISEVVGTLGDVIYDKDIYMVTVTVTDNGDGTLTMDVVYEKDGDVVDSLTFTNTFLETLTITYDLNGGIYKGSTNDIVEQYLYGTTIDIHEAPTREGYKFLYWKGSEYQPGDKYTVVDNHRFVAQWEKIQDNPVPENPVPGKLVQTGAGNIMASLIVSLLFVAAGIAIVRFVRQNNVRSGK